QRTYFSLVIISVVYASSPYANFLFYHPSIVANEEIISNNFLFTPITETELIEFTSQIKLKY
ncbi:hypothetical protein, partial [Escherichia albertii]|uniref:hypothetical protein n=1 Tax=Escherichia albertii TaxID=208962 RepID=UPI0021E882CB